MFWQLYPKPDDSAIQCFVSSGRQTARSIKEESVVSVVLARGRRVNYGWVFRAARRASKLELTNEWGGEQGKNKDGVAEER